MSATNTLGRRGFLKAATATVAGLASIPTSALCAHAEQNTPPDTATISTTCLGCNARCGLRVHTKEGRIARVSGNPYHPYNMGGEPIPYDTPFTESLHVPTPVCGKAHEAGNYAYNPYRIIKPLKRAGKRGEGKFEPIEWEQMIREIADGGQLFHSIGDTEEYPGIRSVLRDDPIDPTAPELGSQRNTFMFIAGRDQSCYQDFSNRFVKNAIGSINRISHTDICGLGFRMGNFALTEGSDVELKADVQSCEYMLIFGANVYEALQPGITYYGSVMAERHAQGKLQFTIIDPRATNASAHADRWVPVTPGQDGAFAMGMIRIMLEQKLYNMEFLSAASPDAAAKRGYAGYCNATHLVITDEKHPRKGAFLRWSDLHPETAEKDEGNAFMVLLKNGDAVPFTQERGEIQLEAQSSIVIQGKKVAVATSFSLLKAAVMAHTLEKYAQLCGVSVAVISRVAKEFAASGTKAAVCQYHGAGNYVGGTYAAYAVAMLSVLVGSVNRQGGYLRGGGSAGVWNKGLYDLTTFEGQKKPAGIPVSREKATYETSSEYKAKKAAGKSGYPAKRPWYSFTRGGLCVEAMNGIDQQYPYGCQVLFTFFFNPVYSIPGGTHYIDTLKSHEKVPLHVSIDVCVNESNLYADYIIPNLTYLEGQYSIMSPHAPAHKFSTVRVPSIAPLTGKTQDGRPFSMETLMIDLAEYLHLPGFGKEAISGADGKKYPLHCAEDYYIRGLANLATACKLPPASDTEMAYVAQHYPLRQFRKLITPEEWQQVCYMILRGGVFPAKYNSMFKNANHLKALPRLALYNENLAAARNAFTGKNFCGTLSLAPAIEAGGEDVAKQDSAYPFVAITYKMNVHAQSRTSSHSWAMELFPENHAVIHEEDAQKLGIGKDDSVRVYSRSCPQGIVIKALPTRLIRKGCVAISFHYGHTQMGAGELSIRDVEHVMLGGTQVGSHGRLKADPRLGAGGSFNALGRLDASLGGTPLTDALGGIPDFSSTRVNIVKI